MSAEDTGVRGNLGPDHAPGPALDAAWVAARDTGARVAGTLLTDLARRYPGSLAALFLRRVNGQGRTKDLPLAARDPEGADRYQDAIDRFQVGPRREARRSGSRVVRFLELTGGNVDRLLVWPLEPRDRLEPVLCLRQPAGGRVDFTDEDLAAIEAAGQGLELVLAAIGTTIDRSMIRERLQALEEAERSILSRLDEFRHVAGCLSQVTPGMDVTEAVIRFASESIARALATDEIVVLLPRGATIRAFMHGRGARSDLPGGGVTRLFHKALLEGSEIFGLEDPGARPTDSHAGNVIILDAIQHRETGEDGAFVTGQIQAGAIRAPPLTERPGPHDHCVVLQWGTRHRRQLVGVLAASRRSTPLRELDRTFLDAAARVIVAVLQVAGLPDDRDLFQTLVERMDDCVFLTDRNAEVDYANPNARDVLGLQTGLNLRNSEHPRLLTLWRRALSGPENNLSHDELVQTPDRPGARARAYHAHTTLLRDVDDRIRGVMFTMRDVFETRVLMRRAIHETSGHVREIQNLLEELPATDPASRSRVGICTDRCQVAMGVLGSMRDMLTTGTMEDLTSRSGDVATVVGDVVGWWSHDGGMEVNLRSGSCAPLPVHEALLRSALDNVFRNARRHALADRGQLMVDVSLRTGRADTVSEGLAPGAAERLTRRLRAAGDHPWTVIDIRDDGPGVRPEDLPPDARLGDLGASRLGGLHGTGLAFINWVAGLHGGTAVAYDRASSGDERSGFGLAIALRAAVG